MSCRFPSTTAKATEANKKATFNKIKFSKAGTYYFTIVETVPEGVDENNKLDGITYNGSKHIAVVTVIDNLEGELVVEEVKYDGADDLTVTNTYGTTDTTTQLEVTKALGSSDAKWPAEGFTFELAQGDEKTTVTLPETKTVVATEAVKTAKFGLISFSAAGTQSARFPANIM